MILMNAGFFFAWLLFYLMAGRVIGAAYGEPIVGAVIGVSIGIYPAAMLCFASHYSGVLSLLVFPLLIVMGMLSESNKFLLALIGGVIPLAWAGGMTVWGLAAERAKKIKKKKGTQKKH